MRRPVKPALCAHRDRAADRLRAIATPLLSTSRRARTPLGIAFASSAATFADRLFAIARTKQTKADRCARNACHSERPPPVAPPALSYDAMPSCFA
ncbi:hypothetical protein, partial [Burkholderia oklahomensis]|uniref:hypothetical protein n=1 Tax=Burkholderia oklahomensis TaxID=342113 RepID=UPI001E591FF7